YKYADWAPSGLLWNEGDDITQGAYKKIDDDRHDDDRHGEVRMPGDNLFDVMVLSGEASIYERLEARKFAARRIHAKDGRTISVALITGVPCDGIIRSLVQEVSPYGETAKWRSKSWVSRQKFLRNGETFPSASIDYLTLDVVGLTFKDFDTRFDYSEL